MRARESLAAESIWFPRARAVEIRDSHAPPPGPGEVRVRTIASALSHGTERLVYRGEVAPDMPLDLPTLEGSFAFPIKYGYAAVGRVIDDGADVTTHAPGDLVFALHPHQTIFTLPAALAKPLPADLDPFRAVFYANLETAVNVALDTPLHFGESAIVFGQGVVGLLIAQVLRLAGARRVFAVEPSPQRQALARLAGVDEVFDPGDDLVSRIHAANDGGAPDVAVEASGAPAALQAAIDVVARDGTVVVASWYGTRPVTLDLGGHFHRGRVRVRSSQVGQINPELGSRWDHARRSATVIDLLPRLRLTELITHRIAFEDAAEAYRLMDERGGETGQIILVYEEK
jgi:threonine dehydrogenase-like Zn-dependent dehydrogenase